MPRSAEAIEKQIAALENAITQAQMKAASDMGELQMKYRGINVQASKNRFDKIKSIFSIAGPLYKDFSPYLVLILLVLLLIGLSAFPKPKLMSGRVMPTTWWTKLKVAIKNILEKLFPVHVLRRWFNPFGKVDTIARTQNAGRCDNATWREYVDPSEPYGGGFCKKTSKPKPYTWNINTNKLPEYGAMPDTLKQTITKNGQKMQVFIPYELQSTFYVPQCNEAYYIEKTPDGKEVQRKFKDEGIQLLVDNGLTCSLVEKPSNQFNQQRPFKALYRKKSDDTSAGRDKLNTCTA